MPQSIYIGYTHAVDWVKLTVNVATAGTYKLSSSFASEPGGADGIKVQVSFNDVLKADVTLPGTGGYHNWADFPEFATVELEAGVQVVQFAPKSMHLNYDYLQLSLVLPDDSLDDGSGTSGGSAGSGGSGGSSGSAGTGGGGASAAGAGGASTAGAAGTAGSAGSGEPLPAAGSGGTPPAPVGSAGASAAGGPGAVPASSEEAGSCRLSAPSRSGSLALFAAGLLLAAARFRRFKR